MQLPTSQQLVRVLQMARKKADIDAIAAETGLTPDSVGNVLRAAKQPPKRQFRRRR